MFEYFNVINQDIQLEKEKGKSVTQQVNTSQTGSDTKNNAFVKNNENVNKADTTFNFDKLWERNNTVSVPDKENLNYKIPIQPINVKPTTPSTTQQTPKTPSAGL